VWQRTIRESACVCVYAIMCVQAGVGILHVMDGLGFGAHPYRILNLFTMKTAFAGGVVVGNIGFTKESADGAVRGMGACPFTQPLPCDACPCTRSPPPTRDPWAVCKTCDGSAFPVAMMGAGDTSGACVSGFVAVVGAQTVAP
jgi:hypothetical protein